MKNDDHNNSHNQLHLPSRRALPLLAILVALPIALACVGFLIAQNQPPAQGSGSSTRSAAPATDSTTDAAGSTVQKVVKTPEQWRQQLTAEQFHVTREKGTERAFTGKWWNNKKPGTYTCVCCDQPVFESGTKFKSGTGWPSYYKPVAGNKVGEVDDSAWGMKRTEVICTRCDAHLGHVFNDGPAPTGLRYCINSASLNFKPQAATSKESGSAEQPLPAAPAENSDSQ